jgi:hypothetical protein
LAFFQLRRQVAQGRVFAQSPRHDYVRELQNAFEKRAFGINDPLKGVNGRFDGGGVR